MMYILCKHGQPPAYIHVHTIYYMIYYINFMLYYMLYMYSEVDASF